MLCLIQDIFDFDYEPMILNVQHLFTSFGNMVMPENLTLVTNSALTEKSGHTQGTGWQG